MISSKGIVSANTILGGAGDDSIDGRAGADKLYGEAGNDTI
jgi:Ca2+-binding RTX toxin-like protein